MQWILLSLFPLLNFQNLLKSDVKILFCCESFGSVLHNSDWTLKWRQPELPNGYCKQVSLFCGSDQFVSYVLSKYLPESKVSLTSDCHQPQSWRTGIQAQLLLVSAYSVYLTCVLFERMWQQQSNVLEVRKHGRFLEHCDTFLHINIYFLFNISGILYSFLEGSHWRDVFIELSRMTLPPLRRVTENPSVWIRHLNYFFHRALFTIHLQYNDFHMLSCYPVTLSWNTLETWKPACPTFQVQNSLWAVTGRAGTLHALTEHQ